MSSVDCLLSPEAKRQSTHIKGYQTSCSKTILHVTSSHGNCESGTLLFFKSHDRSQTLRILPLGVKKKNKTKGQLTSTC